MKTLLPQTPPAPGWLYARPWVGLLLLTLAYVLMRLAVSPALEMDESEQIVWSQQLALGYGMQPPLYTWLQWGVNQLFGPGLLALALLKQALLAGAYALLWQAARRQGLGLRTAWWAAASMLLFPVVGWTIVRDLTHTVLLLFGVAFLYWALVRHIDRPRPSGFVLIGAALATGMLAKYNFALIAACLLGAALFQPGTRRALLSRGWWLAALTALALLGPHLWWMATHGELISSGLATRLHDARQGLHPQHPQWLGLVQLSRSLPPAAALWTLVALAVFGRAWWRPAADAARTAATRQGARLLAWYLALIVLALLGMVLAGASRMKTRWIEPMLILLPMAAFLWRPSLEQHPRGRWFTAAIMAVAALGLCMNLARPHYNMARLAPDDVNLDVPALLRALQATGYDGYSPIVITRLPLGGLMRLHFPQAQVLQCPHKDCAPVLARLQAQGQGWALLLDETEELDRLQAAPHAPALQALDLPYRRSRLSPPGQAVPVRRFWLAWQPPAAPAPANMPAPPSASPPASAPPGASPP